MDDFTGLFLGLFIAILTLISISCFFVFDRKENHELTAAMIFYITEITLLFLSAIVVAIGFCKLQQLQFTSQEDASFEAPLLVIALFGLCVMQVRIPVNAKIIFLEVFCPAILSGSKEITYDMFSSRLK